jgi:hypothetical protein
MKLKHIHLCLCLSLLPTLVFAKSNTQSITELKQIIKAQQTQLSQQTKTLEKQQLLLDNLSKKVDTLSTQKNPSTQKTQAPSEQPTTRVMTSSPSSDSVLKQASSESDVVDIPRHQLILGNKQSQFLISGQISAVAFQANDGRYNHLYIGTNSVSNSRLNFNSQFLISPALTIGSKVQLGFNTNPSDQISQTSPSSNSLDIRRAEIYLKSQQWGKLFFGQGETASENTAYADLSGTKMAGRASVQDIGGGLFFNGISTNPSIGDAFNALDGFSRKVRIRYDTPAFHGLVAAASLIEGNRSDIALKYGNTFANTKVAAEIAYTSPQDLSSGTNAAHGNELNASASLLFPTGISLTGATGDVMASNTGRKNPHYYYIKPGYQFHYFNAGLSAFSVDYGRYTNFDQNNDTAKAFGLQAIQNIDPLDLALYAAYKQFRLTRPGSNFHTINLILFGALYKF